MTHTQTKAALQVENTQLWQANDALRRENEELRRALADERRWLPNGLYLVCPTDGGVRRAWVPLRDGDALGSIYPRAAILRHHEAITRAVMACMDAIRASIHYGEGGAPERWTLPSGTDVANLIIRELERDASEPAQEDRNEQQ